jgi:hypothetical protein
MALNIKKVPSSPTLRQRLGKLARLSQMNSITMEEAADMLVNIKTPITATATRRNVGEHPAFHRANDCADGRDTPEEEGPARRIRTVIQSIITQASRLVQHARKTKLRFSRNNPWLATFQKVYAAVSFG